MTDDRRFNDKEVALILKRAAEMSQAKTAGGLSVAELERVALEAGIDPAAIRQAADEVSRGQGEASSVGRALLGGPTSLRYTFEIDGELDKEHHEALLAAIQRNLDIAGTLNVAGRAFSWHATVPNRSVVVQVSPDRGRTVVRVEERLGALVGGLYGGVGGGVGGTLAPFAGVWGALLLGPVGAVAAVGLCLGATYFGTRALYQNTTRRRKKVLEALTDDLRTTLVEVLPAKRETTAHDDEDALAAARERHGLAAPASAAHAREEVMAVLEEEKARRG